MLNKAPFTPFEMDGWPSGQARSIAVVQIEPSELQSRYGIVFSDGYDDLDYFAEAAVQLPSGQRLLLVRYRHHPSSGTEVRADANDDAQKARQELLRALNTDDSVFSWVSDEEEPPNLE
jgi:hypothetical protein